MNIVTLELDDGAKALCYYNELGQEVRVEDYDADGEKTMVIERHYNDDGLCRGWTVSDGSGGLIKRFEVRFDAEGREIGTDQFNASGELEHSFKPATKD